jgi:hypothetical protein
MDLERCPEMLVLEIMEDLNGGCSEGIVRGRS